MKVCNRKKKNESGASMLETMIALTLMCLIFFGALQLWQWAMAKMFCNYAAFYAGKAYSLGYSVRTINKAARIAAIPVSGPDDDKILKLDKKTLETRLRTYMASGNAGVDFPYWDAKGKDPNLKVSHPTDGAGFITVKLENAPYFDGVWELLTKLGSADAPQKKFPHVHPEGRIKVINHSDGWAE